MKEFISRADIRFLLLIGVVFAGVVIWGMRLEGRVNAMVSEREMLRTYGFERLNDVEDRVIELNDRTIRMEQNQVHIMNELGVNNSY